MLFRSRESEMKAAQLQAEERTTKYARTNAALLEEISGYKAEIMKLTAQLESSQGIIESMRAKDQNQQSILMQLREELSRSDAALSVRLELQTQTELREQAERQQYMKENAQLCATQAQLRIETHELRQQLDRAVQLKDKSIRELEIAQQTHQAQLLSAQQNMEMLQQGSRLSIGTSE